MSVRLKSNLQLLTAGVLWSLGGVFIKSVQVHPLAMASFRSLVALGILLIFLKGMPRFSFTPPLIIGAIGYAGTSICFVTANGLTTAANAILLQYGSIIYIAILGYFLLHEKIRWFDFVAMGGIVCGMFLFFFGGFSNGTTLGNFIAFLSGFTYTTMVICMRMDKEGRQLEMVVLGNITISLVGLPFLLTEFPALPELGPIAFIGIFQLAVPYIFFAKAAQNASALDMTIIPIVEPLLNPVWVYLVMGENPGIYTVIGGVVVLVMIIFRSIMTERVKTAATEPRQ